jgi:DNA-binding response OmpR family regulator
LAPQLDGGCTPLSRNHVFIVNGDSVILEMMSAHLKDEGYKVTTEINVPETFDHILAANPDVIVVDLVVFERRGWDLLEQLHGDSRSSAVPIVIFSTSTAVLDQAKEQVAKVGGNYYLAKPFDLDKFLGVIEQSLLEQ